MTERVSVMTTARHWRSAAIENFLLEVAIMGMVRTLLLALVGLLVSANSTFAGVIGIDVDDGLNSYVGPGVLDTSSRAWTVRETNSTFTLDGQTINLIFGSNSPGGGNTTIDLFDDYKFTTGAAFGVAFTGLDLTKTYNLVVYGAQAAGLNRGATFTMMEPALGALTTNGDQQSSFVSGVNYVRWDNITPDNSFSDQRIRFTVGIGPDGGAGMINGFELEVVEVPEPGSFSMLMFGSVALRALRRKRVG